MNWTLRNTILISVQVVRGTGYVRKRNGTLTGMAKQINEEVGDLSIGSAEYLEYRFTAPDGISYIYPMFHSRYTKIKYVVLYMYV